MQFATILRRVRRFAVLLAIASATTAFASTEDHREFDATLHAPYQADPARPGERTFTLGFDFPHAGRAHDAHWRLDLVAPSGKVVRRWHGVARLSGQPLEVRIEWRKPDALPDGVYRARLHAAASAAGARTRRGLSEGAIDRALARAGADGIEQSWDIAIGTPPAAAMPRFAPMASGPSSAAVRTRTRGEVPETTAAPAAASLPFTVYFANLHSQANHSDGGGDLASCKGGQDPQGGAFGPAAAYGYARERGLDILMVSEHNHMYDGSDGTNPEASPEAARGLYQTGLGEASGFSAANPGFLALYGLEWGVINNGGHLNIFNAPELLGWERGAGGELFGDTLTAKGDYAGVYSLMRQRGWIGQFNHPALKGQFMVNGVGLGYTQDGDEAMVMCEVLNTSVFSTNTTESETRRSTYEMACNKALEAGYHVAFSSNQDNHCANWGASYTNRTGILIPNGTALTHDSFTEALKARRVFATMDKNSQLVLTANGHVMGSRITNRGPLRLVANYANTEGRSVATVSLVEGVPGRNGAVTEVAAIADATITPEPGEHFYYAKLTQDDGKILWSAPVWVSQEKIGG